MVRGTNPQGLRLNGLHQRERPEHDGRMRIRLQAVQLVWEGWYSPRYARGIPRDATASGRANVAARWRPRCKHLPVR